MRFLSTLLLLPTAIAAPGSLLVGRSTFQHPHSPVAYFLDNDPAGNSIVSLKISSDGTLSDPVRTSTNGCGSFQVNATGAAVMADTLGSQGAVRVSGDVSPFDYRKHALRLPMFSFCSR